MIDILAAITVAFAIFGIMGMVLVPTTRTHSRLRRFDQRPAFAQWFAKHFDAPRSRSTSGMVPWWSAPFQGL